MNKKSKIYIAGHTGLVGSTLTRILQQQGYTNLIARDRTELDLSDATATDRFFEQEKPEYVFVAAAKVGGILENSTYPAEFIHDNIRIASNIIHSAYTHNVKKLLHLGSSCIYPHNCRQPIKEKYFMTGPLEPTNDAYAIAKIAGIKMCQSYNKQYNTNFITAMPTNLYGPGDNFDLKSSHVLPALLRKFIEAKQQQKPFVTIWGTGSPKREFMYVEDMAQACVFLMDNYNENEIINIGTGQDVSILELAHIIQDVTGYQGAIQHDISKPNGMPRKWLDVSKLHNLGFKHTTYLRDGIEETYHWYMKEYAKEEEKVCVS